MSDSKRILAGYSAEMLEAAFSELSASKISGRAGKWETDRLAEITAERQRRQAAAIERREKIENQPHQAA